jgi:hypothetical protein
MKNNREKEMKKDFDVRGFLYEEVINECDKYKTVEDQIEYLQYVMTEWKFNRPRLDPNGDITPRFGERIETEIEKKKDILKFFPTQKSKTPKITETNELIWWKGSAPTLLYLFELLYEARLIDDRQYEKERSALLEKHFRNENGNKYENETLNKTFSRMRDEGLLKKPNNKDAERIEEVIIEIRNLLRKLV